MKKLIISVVLLLSFAASVLATGGTSSLPFLRVGISPEFEAMGGVFWGANSGAINLWYNPANLAQGFPNGSLCYKTWIDDLSLTGFQVRMPVYTGGLAVGIINHSLGTIKNYNTDGISGPDINPNEFVLGFGFGSYISQPVGMALGLNVKYAQSELIEDDITRTFLVDLGLLYDRYGMVLGAVAKNLGPNIESGSRLDPPPSEIHFGGSLPTSFSDGTMEFRIGADAVYPIEGDFRFGVGAEFNAHKTIQLRLGYKGGSDLESLTAGVGLSWKNIAFNYAYGPLSSGTDSHLFSIGAAFDGFSLANTRTYSEKAEYDEYYPSGTSGNLTNLSFDAQPEMVVIYLDYSGTCSYRDFSLADPRRIVLDLMGLQGITATKSINVGQQGISKIRAGAHDGFIRVVIDIAEAQDYRVIQYENQIQVHIR